MSAAVDASDGDAAPRPMRKDAVRNRQLLLDAGRAVFAERGLEASLDDVAKAAGVGVGTAYRHFANKAELAAAIFAEAVEDMVKLADHAATMDDPADGIAAFLRGAAEAQTVDRGLREVLMGQHDAARHDDIHQRLRGPLRALVERARESGAIRREVEVTDVGLAVMMLCTVADATADVAPDLWRRYLPMLLDGLRAGTDLPVPAISEDELRAALARYKQRQLRASVQ